jgi:hypothetical protein
VTSTGGGSASKLSPAKEEQEDVQLRRVHSFESDEKYVFFRVFTGCLQGVYRVFTGCLQGVYRVFTGCLQGVYRVFTGCLQVVYRGFYGV